MLHENDLLPNTVDYLSPGEVGGSHMCSDETKAKISQSLRGRKLTDEHDGETKKGGKKSTCKHDDCDKWSVSGEFCGKHGGKKKAPEIV